jgi:opacity protein-like surface antigen
MELTRKNMLLLAGAIVALVVAYLFWTEKAQANPWTGCYVGAGGAYSGAHTDTSLDVAGVGSVLGVDGLGAQGEGLFGAVGCDLQLPNSKIVVGAFADYLWHNDTTFSVYGGVPSVTILETSLDNAWSVGGRLGYAVTDGALVYGLVGYSRAQMDDITSPLAPGFALSIPDLSGYVFGGGTEIALGKGLFLQAQYSYTDYEKESIDLGAPFSIGIDQDVQTFRTGLVWRFGGSDVERLTGSAPLK